MTEEALSAQADLLNRVLSCLRASLTPTPDGVRYGREAPGTLSDTRLPVVLTLSDLRP